MYVSISTREIYRRQRIEWLMFVGGEFSKKYYAALFTLIHIDYGVPVWKNKRGVIKVCGRNHAYRLLQGRGYMWSNRIHNWVRPL